MTPMLRVIAILSFAALAASFCTPAFTASALERAYRVIKTNNSSISRTASTPTTPVWSGFGQAKMTPAADPKTKKPYTIQGRRLPHHVSTRWSGSTARTSIRRRISTRRGSRWTKSRSSR